MFWRKKKSVAEAINNSAPDKASTGLFRKALFRLGGGRVESSSQNYFEPYRPIPGVIPKELVESALAMDSIPYDQLSGMAYETSFPGFPYLAQMAQKPEYRKIISTIAEEMTRKWIKIQSVGDDDKTDRIERIEKTMTKMKVRESFRKMIEDDGFFGRGQIYLDMKMPKGNQLVVDNKAELGKRLVMDPAKVTLGSFKGLINVEPMWTYPSAYNSDQPMRRDFYRPTSWYVMGQTVHNTRMLTMIARPVPDMLKATYAFGGLSMTQICEPYINNWISTRDSVKDMIRSYSMTGLKTNLQAVLGADGQDFLDRIELLQRLKDNRGLIVIDNASVDAGGEEFFQFNAPLSGLSELQAQAEEQMAIIPGIPLVKLLGITPSGLNASSDGELRVFYDTIHSKQEADIRDLLKTVIDMIQLSEFGDIDEDITFIFEPLFQLSDQEKSIVRMNDSTANTNYTNAGVLSVEEVREALAADPESPYHSLETGSIPEQEEEEEEEQGEGEEGDAIDPADTGSTR